MYNFFPYTHLCSIPKHLTLEKPKNSMIIPLAFSRDFRNVKTEKNRYTFCIHQKNFKLTQPKKSLYPLHLTEILPSGPEIFS